MSRSQLEPVAVRVILRGVFGAAALHLAPQRNSQHPEVLDSVDATERFLCLQEAGSYPAQRHVLIAPALHTSGRRALQRDARARADAGAG